jgi:hypothetical protein
MVKEKNIKKIVKMVKEDFSFLEKKVLGILLYGSTQRNEYNEKSDIDICIVAPKQEPRKILKEVFRKVDVYGKKYDVRIFEELPLYIKIEIIRNHTVVFGDIYDLYEYFYSIRKLWDDQKHRQEVTKEEILKSL